LINRLQNTPPFPRPPIRPHGYSRGRPPKANSWQLADAPQGFGHRVGTLPERDELAAGVGQFGKLEGRLGTELTKLGQGLFGLGSIADESGEGDLGLLEITPFHPSPIPSRAPSSAPRKKQIPSSQKQSRRHFRNRILFSIDHQNRYQF
jgi:hypothetical protein